MQRKRSTGAWKKRMEEDKKYPVLRNLGYCVRATRQEYPKLLIFCLLMILANCLVPVITAFLPKAVLDGITEGWPLRRLIAVTAAMISCRSFFLRSASSMCPAPLFSVRRHGGRLSNRTVNVLYHSGKRPAMEFFEKCREKAGKSILFIFFYNSQSIVKNFV